MVISKFKKKVKLFLVYFAEKGVELLKVSNFKWLKFLVDEKVSFGSPYYIFIYSFAYLLLSLQHVRHHTKFQETIIRSL